MATSPKTRAVRPKRPLRPGQAHWHHDFENLNGPEQQLVKCCWEGRIWMPEKWNGERPEEKTTDNTIRADVIRFLVMNKYADYPLHELGVMVWGAWIEGILNLTHCRAAVRLSLKGCQFDSELYLESAHLSELRLVDTLVPGLRADRLRVTGNIFLSEGFKATGAVRLRGAQIGGALNCSNGSFNNMPGDALCADQMKVSGSVYLNKGFTASGEVRLFGAEVGGNLDCDEGSFTNQRKYALSANGVRLTGSLYMRNGFTAIGEVGLVGAKIGGVLDCATGTFSNPGSNAISANGIKVTDDIVLYSANIMGAVLLSAAQVGSLIDDSECWKNGKHDLDGLRYERITGRTDAAHRKDWLKTQKPNHLNAKDWRPQPWEQLIKVLREMGHPLAAAEIAMEKQRMMRAAGQIGTRQPGTHFKRAWRRWLDAQWNPVSNSLSRIFHSFYGWIAGYGYRPTRIAGRMTMLWLLCAIAFYAGRENGYFGPSSPLIHANQAFAACGAPGEMGANKKAKPYWSSADCPTPPEYTTMQPALYSLDLILPLVDLQQDQDWAPIVSNENGAQLIWGHLLRVLMWFEILFGWFASLMFVAIISRLVEKD